MNGPSANRGQPMHRECLLRNGLGGIGHLIDHDHFCDYLGDPDAGLSYRLSSLLVDVYVTYNGVEESVERSLAHERPSPNG